MGKIVRLAPVASTPVSASPMRIFTRASIHEPGDREFQPSTQREELESCPGGLWEHVGQALRIVGRRCGDSNVLEIEPVFAMEPGVHACEMFKVIRARRGDRGHEIDMRRFAAEAVVLRKHETAEASQLDLARQARVEFS
jgi:hypothetical protein